MLFAFRDLIFRLTIGITNNGVIIYQRASLARPILYLLCSGAPAAARNKLSYLTLFISYGSKPRDVDQECERSCVVCLIKATAEVKGLNLPPVMITRTGAADLFRLRKN